MKIKRIRDVKLPTRGTPGSAGIDFYMPNSPFSPIVIPPGEAAVIPLGVKVEIPKGHVLIAFNKSGVAINKHLYVGACVIDEDYQGEIHAHLTNIGKTEVSIYSGEKIVQFILLPYTYTHIEEVDSIHEDPTERGEGAFGSTNHI